MPRGHLFARLEEGILALLLVSMTLLVFAEVVLRFGFGTGVLWAQELTLHLAAWLVLFGAAYGVKVGAHIGVDAAIRLVPPGPRRLLSGLAVLLCLIYCGLMLYGSWVYLEKMWQLQIRLEDLPIPKWLAHSVLLLGFGLLALRLIEILGAIARGRPDAFRFADEASESLERLHPLPDRASGPGGA